jgi:hypothetical protein
MVPTPVAARSNAWSAAARLLGFWIRILSGAWVSVVIVVCFQAEVSASGWSFVQRSPTEYDVSECNRESSTKRPWPTMAVSPW